jgi:dipeptidyl aminopeptidase/acylaminoacyl peptidase
VGGNLGQSSDVQAILSYYGASNLLTILPQSTPFGLGLREPALELLLGGQPQDREELSRLASPVFHLDANDPPLLLLHGDQDPQMPVNQSLELYGAYRAKGLKAEFLPVYQAAHGGRQFHEGEQLKAATDFLTKSLFP